MPIQWPTPIPDTPGITPTAFDHFAATLIMLMLLASLIAFCLPRPWFLALFKVAFPFMPDRLEGFDEDK